MTCIGVLVGSIVLYIKRLNIMSYDDVLVSLKRCKATARQESFDRESLIEALEQLVVVLESDLTQIKVALSHNASLLEKR